MLIEPPRDKTNKMACAPSEDSDQPGHPPSLIRDFAVRSKKAMILSYPLSVQRRLWSDWADAQADLSLRWAHMPFRGFCNDAAQLSAPASCSRSVKHRLCLPGIIKHRLWLTGIMLHTLPAHFTQQSIENNRYSWSWFLHASTSFINGVPGEQRSAIL